MTTERDKLNTHCFNTINVKKCIKRKLPNLLSGRVTQMNECQIPGKPSSYLFITHLSCRLDDNLIEIPLSHAIGKTKNDIPLTIVVIRQSQHVRHLVGKNHTARFDVPYVSHL